MSENNVYGGLTIIRYIATMDCPICDSVLRQKTPNWFYRCLGCGFEASSLNCEPERIVSNEEQLDEVAREAALRALRQQNFRVLLNKAFGNRDIAGLTLLEVGCGHGWFLEEAKRRGLITTGIEPDAKIARRSAASHDHSILNGFFPEVLEGNERFDTIVFNDVFEHLTNVHEAMSAVDRHLSANGYIILNLPSRHGIFYRMAKALMILGVRAPFERMWQKGMPSPHLSYFTADDVRRLCARYGFEEEHRFSLPSLPLRNLWQRLRLSKSNPVVADVAIWAGCMLLIPFLRFLPPDITVQSLRRTRH